MSLSLTDKQGNQHYVTSELGHAVRGLEVNQYLYNSVPLL